jgi:FkbM family methyltransferase
VSAKLFAERAWVKLLARFGHKMFNVKDDSKTIDVLSLLVHDQVLSKTPPAIHFVQIGANDGMRDDPVRPLMNKSLAWGDVRWSGILVEPNPNEFGLLKRNYAGHSGLEFEQAAVADSDGTTTLYCSDGGGEETVASSLDRGIAAASLSIYKSRMAAVQVPAMTLPTLFARHGVKQVDLFVTDTEGRDHRVVLQLLERTEIRPVIIQFEHALMSGKDYDACRLALRREEYALLQVRGDTLALRK